MKKIILIYGLIAGIITGAMLFVTIPMFNNGTLNPDNGHILGFSTMAIAFSVIFVAVKKYRDDHANGAISFGKALKIGLLITLVASIVYAISWEICYHTVASGFNEMMTEQYMKNLVSEGKDESALVIAREEMNQFMIMYKNPIIRFGITMMEIFPVGLIMTLASALLMKRKVKL